MRSSEFVTEKWSAKYKRSINCNNPKGFSQRAHCQGRKKTNEQDHSPPHELRAFLAIPEVKKELDKLRFVIHNTPANLLVKIPRSQIVDDLLKRYDFRISPRGKELVYQYLKGNNQYLKEE